MSTQQDRELRSDIQEIQALIDALQQGTLREIVEVPGRFLESDEAQLINLVLLQRTINELAALRGQIRGVRNVGDPLGAEQDPVAALLEGDRRRFAINKNVEATTRMWDDDITPNRDNAVFRITIALDTATTLSAHVDEGGQASGAQLFNEGNNLGAGQIFSFDLPGIPGDASVNYETGADAIANFVSVVELNAEAP